MLLACSFILLFLWGVGAVTQIIGGLIHIALLSAVVLFALHFVQFG